jgi:hypothetical protein
MMSAEQLERLREACRWQEKVSGAKHALFRVEYGTPGIVGTQGQYQWLTMVGRDVTSVLQLCPEIVLGKYLAVTCIDGGPLRLTDQDMKAGWWTSEAGRVFVGAAWAPPEYRDDWKAADSPQMASIHGLPNETRRKCRAGYDEWYVVDHPLDAEEIETFVGWGGFRLYDPEFQWRLDRFWSRIARSNPESYLADGTLFTVVTRNPALFDRILTGYLTS